MANADGNATKRLKEIITTIHKSVECPLCLETVQTPFKLCANGHAVCLECTTKLEKCPLCRELFTLENPVCVKSILEALPRLCRYSDDGCEEIVEPGNDHEMFCGYRPICCRVSSCSAIVLLRHLNDHYEEEHPLLIIWNESITSISCINDPEYQNFSYQPFFVFDNFFWILKVYDAQEKQLRLYFQATPIGKLEHDYYIRVIFQKDNFNYTYTLKAFVSSCEDKVLTSDEINLLGGQDFMKIPLCELPRLTGKNGLLCNEYYFFRV